AIAFPSHVVAVDWNEEVYKRDSMALWCASASGQLTAVPLVNLALRTTSVTHDQIVFVIEDAGLGIEVEYRLGRPRWFSLPSGDVSCGDAEGRRLSSLLDFLHNYPPAFYGADLSRLEGNVVSTPPFDMEDVFDTESIEEIDWGAATVDPLVEKPNN